MSNKILKTTAAFGLAMLLLGSADGALAKPVVQPPPFQLGAFACHMSDIALSGGTCGGYFEGNMNSDKPDALTASAAEINSLLGVSTFTASNLTWLKDVSPATSPVSFGQTMYGQTLVSFHVGGANGAANGVGYQGTGFYLFDAGVQGLSTLNFKLSGLSNARLYSTGVYAPPTPPVTPTGAIPEPSTWAMMMAGLACVGALLRRRRAGEAQITAA